MISHGDVCRDFKSAQHLAVDAATGALKANDGPLALSYSLELWFVSFGRGIWMGRSAENLRSTDQRFFSQDYKLGQQLRLDCQTYHDSKSKP